MNVRVYEFIYFVALGAGSAGVRSAVGFAVEILQKGKADCKGIPAVLFVEEYGVRDFSAVHHSGKGGNHIPVALNLRKSHIFLNML